MVSRRYMLAKQPKPSSAKVVFDQEVIPVFINAAGRAEAALEGFARLVRRSPAGTLCGAVAAGALLSQLRFGVRQASSRRRW